MRTFSRQDMTGYVVTTEVGYSVYLSTILIADVDTQDEAKKALETTNLPWNGKMIRRQSSYMPCQ